MPACHEHRQTNTATIPKSRKAAMISSTCLHTHPPFPIPPFQSATSCSLASSSSTVGGFGKYRRSSGIWRAMDWNSGRVLGPAPPDSDWWDRKLFSGAVVVRNAGEYRMYYYGRAGDEWNMGVAPFNDSLPTGRVGMAVSTDGLRFERRRGALPGGAVMDPSHDPQAFDSVHIAVGDAFYSPHRRKWILYYFGGGTQELPLVGSPSPAKYKGVRLLPGIAYSDDGFLFDQRRGPLLDVGESGAWDQNGVAWPRIFSGDGGSLFMTYHTRETGGPDGRGFFSAGLAVSRDGEGGKWEKVGKILSCGDAGSWDEGGVSVRHVIRVGGQFVMFYEGSNSRFEFAIGLAISDDGVTWMKDVDCGAEPGGPILRARKGVDVWDNVIVGTPYVLQMPDGSFRMFYLGVGKRNGQVKTENGIGLAVSDGPNFRSWRR